MNLDQIKTLIDAMAASDLAEMEFSEAGWTLKLVRHAPETASASPPGSPSRTAPARIPRDRAPRHETVDRFVRAPTSGIVYLGPGPKTADFVAPGHEIIAGARLCVIEAMKVFHEVAAERAGIVEAILVASGQEVEAGQPLMRIG